MNAEAFKDQALDLAPIMIREFGGRISYWARGLERLYHYGAADALGHTCQDLLRTAAAVPLSAIEAEVRDSGAWAGELVQERKDGRQVVVTSQWSLLCDTDGQQAALMVCNVDITRQHAAKAEREYLASIVEGSEDAIIGKSLDGVITSWNSAAEKIFGYAAPEIIGRPILELFPTDLVEEEDSIIARLKRGERIEHYETRRLAKGGREIEVALTVSPVRSAVGQIVGASKIVRDVTEQNRLRRELNELQKELLHISRLNDMGQMAAALAHELNQPLSAISNYVGAARRLIENGDLERAADGCRLASEQAVRAGDVIRRLRNFVRKQESQWGEIELARLIQESRPLALIGNSFEDVEVRVEIGEEAGIAFGDEVQVQQILVNLLRNAGEAMSGSDEKLITVSTRKLSADMIELEVADTGPGLSADVLARLFQPFVTTKATGMGIGLSLCRSIAESHGGALTAENAAGGGAVFRLRLASVSKPAAVGP